MPLKENGKKMIQLSHNIKGWTATCTDTGKTATATFDEGKGTAQERLQDAINAESTDNTKTKRKWRERETEG